MAKAGMAKKRNRERGQTAMVFAPAKNWETEKPIQIVCRLPPSLIVAIDDLANWKGYRSRNELIFQACIEKVNRLIKNY